MTYYSALHYAAKAEKSANLAEQYATQATQFSGKVVQIGFDGFMENGQLVFKHSPAGVDIPYDLLDDYEYEIDMVYQGSDLADDVELVVENGADTINFVSALHRDSTTPVTVKDMKSVMRYDESTGYRWLFKAAFKVTPLGNKVLLLYPVISIGGSGTGRNIGDIFYTSRLDTELNGAVEADGTIYSVEAFTGEKSVPALLADGKLPYVSLAEYESIVSANGSCRAWGWDNGDTFRVPTLKDVYLMAGQAESAGEFISESLPNITGQINAGIGDPTGPFYDTGTSGGTTTPGGIFSLAYVGFDASRSSSTYQNGAKVRPDSVRYRAMVQLATGVKEDATQLKEYKFNNPCFFGQSMWTDITPNNSSWLLSNGAFHSGATYGDYYEWLIGQRNVNLKTVYLWKSTIDEQIMFATETDTLSVGTTIYGYMPTVIVGEIVGISGNDVTIRNDVTNQVYTQSIDVANPIASSSYLYDRSKINVISKTELDYWTYPNNTSDYDFVINTDDQTFRLPLKTKLASGSAVVGNGMTLGLTDGTNNQGISFAQYGVSYGVNNYGKPVGASEGGGGAVTSGKTAGVTTDPEKSGIETSSNGLKLYYYVGDTLQDPALINAGRVLSDVADLKQNKADVDASNFNADGKSLLSGLGMPSDRYINLTLGASGASYTAPANGYFVMSGVATAANAYVYFVGAGMNPRFYSPPSGGTASGFCPAQKGQSFRIDYSNINANANTTILRFIYAEGDQ